MYYHSIIYAQDKSVQNQCILIKNCFDVLYGNLLYKYLFMKFAPLVVIEDHEFVHVWDFLS